MHLLIQNISTTLREYTAQQRQLLETLFTVKVPNYQFMHAYKTGKWDGSHHFFNAQASTIPTGFLPYLLTNISRKNWSVTFKDFRNACTIAPTTEYEDNLRWYQVDAINAVLLGELRIGEEYLPWHRGVIKAPTASGKTPMAARLIQALDAPTLYLVESIDNMTQTQRVIQEWTGKPCGILGDGIFNPQQVTVCSLRTLMSRRKSLKSYFHSIECLITDEVHKLSNNSYHTIMLSCPNASIRVGISATPLSRDDLGDLYLIGDTGEILYEVQRKQLEDEGFLSRARIVFLPITQPVDHQAKYQIAYKELIVNNTYRNQKILWALKKLLSMDHTVLILTKHLEHGQILQDLCKQNNILSYYVSGKDTSELRQSLLRGVGDNFKVLISSGIFDESIDCPALNDLILAGGGDSAIKSIQRPGRVLRKKNSGPDIAYIVDFNDATNKHLMRHSEHRFQIYKQEGFDVKIIR